ncbi:GMC family oxidoreductase N-terminal domain-containing protein [Dactylosporangium sp. NPDC005572]|uniref:GMC family oxidoreductase n=1 Tax=Dactylosporangium sp. NPDC005572 TaxID=3156889 RepID=UPI0033B9F472
MSDEYDYIIVGSGAAGSTLAFRLAQSGRNSVLVLEAGPANGNPMRRIPKGFFFTLNGDRYTYHYVTQPISGTATTEVWTRGKVTGGSTTVNGMMYSRGRRADFEALRKYTKADHWGWDSVLATYRAMENHSLGASPTRGVGGRLAISADGPHDELADRIFAAASEMGWRRVDDLNDGDFERIGYTASTVYKGRRTSAATAFLAPALRGGKVHLAVRTRVARIIVANGRAVGVEASHRGSPKQYRARKEVILAAGTIESPALLERSGIGRGEVLRGLGVDVIIESPNVGERVIEQHGAATVQARLTQGLGATEKLNSWFKQGLGGALYLLTRRGPIATAGYDFTFQCKSEPSVARPDLVGSVTPFAIDPTATTVKLADHAGMLVGMYQIRPETRSTIHASSIDPDAPPVISPHYFETETDIRASGHILGRSRELLAKGPLAEVISGEDFPTEAVPSDPEAALEYGRQFGATIYHAVGSCAMGQANDDVVDAQLRVRGVEGLRVVDASVLPFQVSGNTAAPTMAIGWIAGGLIASG